MGAVLRRAAFSPNIKDRLDYSCAIFDAAGELCAQAAHIPVHLGSMAYAMASIVGRLQWRPGDMVVLNDPFIGGTHLPKPSEEEGASAADESAVVVGDCDDESSAVLHVGCPHMPKIVLRVEKA